MKRRFIASVRVSGYCHEQDGWSLYVSSMMSFALMKAVWHDDERISTSISEITNRATANAKVIRKAALEAEKAAAIEAARPINRIRRFFDRMRIHHLN